jgi:hypothetical protein
MKSLKIPKNPNSYRQNIYIYKTKDRVTRTPLKTGGELICSGNDTHRVNQTLDILFKQTIRHTKIVL